VTSALFTARHHIRALAIEIAAPLVSTLLVCLLPTCASIESDTPAHGFLAQRELHVSPRGNDAWSGRLASPNRDGTDGPLATLTAARDELRELRYQRGESGPFRVLIHGGTYELDDTLVLAPEDGAHSTPNIDALSSEEHVVYEAFEEDRPVISGGRRLTGWSVEGDGRWTLGIPEVARGEWTFEQLYVDGQRRSRPRLPESGYFTIGDAVPPTDAAKGKGFDRFRFEGDDLRADWNALGDLDVLCFHLWSMSRMHVASIDNEQHIVTLTGPTCAPDAWASLPKGHRFLVENVREALKKPGQWYLDRMSGVLTYLPMPGEDPLRTEIVAPRLERLVELGIASENPRGIAVSASNSAGVAREAPDSTGVPAQDPSSAGSSARDSSSAGDARFVESVVFRGLTFAYTTWTVPPEGWSFPQAEVASSAAISAVNARDCAFEQCTFEHTGAWAIELGRGCKRDRVENCELTDLGAGGIKIGEMTIRESEDDVASDDSVRECSISHGGRIQPAAVGVWIGQSHDDVIANDDISDFYYTGVSVGWTWGYGKSLAHHNRIESNRIAFIGQHVLSDMGGIYTLGVAPGTVLRGNAIHDVESFDYGGWGIYPDEGSSELTIEDNVVWRTKSASFHQHYGRENLVRNNVFAFGREAQIMRTRAEDHLSFTMQRNIVYWSEGKLLASNWSGDHYAFDDNVYWNASGQPFDFAGLSFDDWRKKGEDVHSLVADPRFIDAEDGDFRLKPDSPALTLGIESIDARRAGRTGRPPEVAPSPRSFP
jgi:Right handed beta helix region